MTLKYSSEVCETCTGNGRVSPVQEIIDQYGKVWKIVGQRIRCPICLGTGMAPEVDEGGELALIDVTEN